MFLFHACCACACVLLLHAEPAPFLPASAWLGRLSAAPPFAAATLLFPPLPQPVLLTLGLVLVLGLGRAWEGSGGGGGPSPLIAVQPPTKIYFCQTPETLEPLKKYIPYQRLTIALYLSFLEQWRRAMNILLHLKSGCAIGCASGKLFR